MSTIKYHCSHIHIICREEREHWYFISIHMKIWMWSVKEQFNELPLYWLVLIHLLCEATSYPSPEHDDDDLLGVTCYMLGCARVAVSRSRLSPILHLTQPQPRTLSLVAGSYSPVLHLTSPHLLSYIHLTCYHISTSPSLNPTHCL